MADIAPDHLFLAQRLPFVLLCAVIVVMMYHGSAAVVSQLRRRHRRTLQVAAQVFHAVPGSPGLLREVDLPVTAVLRIQITPPLLFVADMTQTRQSAGIYQRIAVTQQPDDGPPPDFLHRLFFEEQRTPDAMFNVEPAAGDGDVNVRVLIQLAAVGVQGAENTHFNPLFAGPALHGPGGTAEQRVEQRPVVVEEGP